MVACAPNQQSRLRPMPNWPAGPVMAASPITRPRQVSGPGNRGIAGDGVGIAGSPGLVSGAAEPRMAAPPSTAAASPKAAP